ncbi:hypothetical protein RFI_40311 [Reticulomyxa filosa]|uniref:Uncharacterized protein n=1 Tax=Reticulomyxa filosa TaxID=46433 RepID=X6L7C4_RETFI|nr:hypothetical protein RFI_40311 [Reticulomyxa filosa]|eukprot:ETN97220.1 hypothetical protein RFI_40311 [Reticulomyxa filosa]
MFFVVMQSSISLMVGHMEEKKSRSPSPSYPKESETVTLSNILKTDLSPISPEATALFSIQQSSKSLNTIHFNRCQVPIHISSKCSYLLELTTHFSWEGLLAALKDIPHLSYSPDDFILIFSKQKDHTPNPAALARPVHHNANDKVSKEVVVDDVELNADVIEKLFKNDPFFYLSGKIWLLRRQELGFALTAFAIRANKMLKQERYTEALKCYESMVDEFPTDANLHVDHGDCLCLMVRNFAIERFLFVFS